MLIYLSMIDTEENRCKFEELYIQYRQLMFYTANQILKDNFLSEDAVHLAFIRIAKNINKINSIDCPKTKSFVVIIVKRIAIDLYRKKQRERSISFEEYYTDTNSELALDMDDDSDNIVINAIEKLPEIYKEMLILKFRHDFSNEEISNLLEISRSNVEKRIQRARKKLLTLLNDMEANSIE